MTDVMDDGTAWIAAEGEPPESEPAPSGYDENDPTTWPPTDAAPYGFKANGEPYRRRPNGTGRAAGSGKGKGGGRKRGRSKVDYGGVITDLIMSVAQPLGIAGIATKNTTMLAHSWLLSDRAHPIGNAMQGVCEQNEKIAAAVERLAEVSPYAELTAAIMPAVPQFLCNMGLIKPGFLGTIDPEDIAAAMYRQAGQTPPPPVVDVESEEVPPSGNGSHAYT